MAKFTGEMGHVTAQAFTRDLLNLLNSGEQCIVLYLGDVPFSDSAGLNAILTARRRRRARRDPGTGLWPGPVATAAGDHRRRRDPRCARHPWPGRKAPWAADASVVLSVGQAPQAPSSGWPVTGIALPACRARSGEAEVPSGGQGRFATAGASLSQRRHNAVRSTGRAAAALAHPCAGRRGHGAKRPSPDGCTSSGRPEAGLLLGVVVGVQGPDAVVAHPSGRSSAFRRSRPGGPSRGYATRMPTMQVSSSVSDLL
ncbi:STAS domain-containing protein [Streptomyces puniciscabiei]